jgi:hypothetical protein
VNSDERTRLWILATKNVAAEVYELQLAEFRRLTASRAKSLTTHRDEAESFVAAEAIRLRTPGMTSGSFFQRGNWYYPVIELIRRLRTEYNANLKESKDFVEMVIGRL